MSRTLVLKEHERATDRIIDRFCETLNSLYRKHEKDDVKTMRIVTGKLRMQIRAIHSFTGQERFMLPDDLCDRPSDERKKVLDGILLEFNALLNEHRPTPKGGW